ncbi:competence/damage-inducible protein cinA [Corynebacterium pollutisoli]|uniref:Competence/damage-inducible protein cinA n=1 Tax=Corynebacterium pollutisoli TaxID=1610489 RepID=A0A1X7IAH3_9CORY|nr:CinA family protein [Corynebacterium pollutisoli]SMG11428.1 competence/damage-inducible protein cinA [Corynebacterium pollutisoli]HJD78584.1 CinA family protein [Corynebacterium pollutisoli]
MSLVDALRRRGLTVAFCESLTAGLAAATLADTPGASAVLRGGLITYATDLKYSLAGVPEGADPVDGDTAVAMARGARERCGADWGVALTGVAGPDPQDGHAVGEVWLGFAGPGGVDKQRLQLSGDRREIREQAVNAALDGLRARVEQNDGVGR